MTLDELLQHWHTEQRYEQAFIRADECIGCAKCLKACPFDAIIGASKWLHQVIPQECTGCTQCVPACPVDCIEMRPHEAFSAPEQSVREALARTRFEAREQRLQPPRAREPLSEKQQRRLEIEAALARVKARRGAS